MTYQTKKDELLKRFIEEGAALEHARWARWQSYLHGRCIQNDYGSLTIPKELADRWTHQIARDYKHLSESEKESDRKEVREYEGVVSRMFDELARDVAEAGRVEFREEKPGDALSFGFNNAIAASQEKLRAYGVPLSSNKEKV